MALPEWFASGQNETIFLRRLLDHISDRLVAVDTDGRVVLINEPYCQLLGGKPEDFIGHHITDVVSPKTKLHLVARGDMVVHGAPLEVRGQQLFTRQVPIYQDTQIIGAVGMALFSSLSALKKAASVAVRQELSFQSTQRGWIARHTLDDIMGAGPRMEALRQRIRQAARQSQPVLIQGESGTGKELAANAVHAHSDRAGRPFVWINCASMPETLIEAELFGYEAGAFTGANPRGKPGKFELANSGTLFLDEIGDMPIHLQAILLRAIQNQEIVRIGGTSPIPIDVRFVCATNRPLERMVRANRFRLDLYYRLNVLNLHMPALRERDDLEFLIEHLLARITRQEGHPVRKMPGDVLAKFLAFSWPGNVRQLESALLRFLISGEADFDDVRVTEDAEQNAGAEESLDLERYLALQRERRIAKALRVAGDDKNRAAKLLGISRATLYRELRRSSDSH
ncbi:MAG: sigma-54 interaction domain-containing protein [Hyphomicrobiaceae bacterium]